MILCELCVLFANNTPNTTNRRSASAWRLEQRELRPGSVSSILAPHPPACGPIFWPSEVAAEHSRADLLASTSGPPRPLRGTRRLRSMLVINFTSRTY